MGPGKRSTTISGCPAIHSARISQNTMLTHAITGVPAMSSVKRTNATGPRMCHSLTG